MKTLALDADDTLWENIDFFLEAQAGLCRLLHGYAAPEQVEENLFKKESLNVPLYGYGTKSFVLSMVELAIELTGGAIPSSLILDIHQLGKNILLHPMKLLRGVEETVPILASKYHLVVATKGELLEQQQKLERSGLKPYVASMHVMSNKRKEDYQRLLDVLRVAPEDFIMVGNTLKSDVLPVVSLGGTGIYIPHHYTWEHEIVSDDSVDSSAYIQLEHFGQLTKTLL